MPKLVMESLTLACRLCLQCKSDSNSLFDEVEYDEYIKLSSVFKKVTRIEILDTEAEKPTRLCHECTERLLSAYEFILAVEKAEQEIEKYMIHGIIREELPTQPELCYVEAETSDIEIHGIEVLDDEFLTDHDPTELSNANEVFTEEDIIAESSTEIYEELLPSTEKKQRKTSTNPVGSRLSKRQSANYLKCNSCQRSFAKVETLERHIKMAHTVISTTTVQSSQNGMLSENRITCPYCPQFFKRRNNYVRHLITCHPNEAECLTAEDKELAKTKQNYKKGVCPHCGESFTQASLIIHIRRHTGVNPYECDQCDKAFPRRQDLNIHQRQHTGEKPHACTVCGKSFSRANKLARHMRIHTGERPYKCTKCERCFTQSNDLKIHMRRHTGEKPYKCSLCSEAFICGAALRTHRRQKNHHSPEDDHVDPFANWRVCKRKMKTNADADIKAISEDFCSEKIVSDQYEDFLDVEYTYDDETEETVKAEPVEITQVLPTSQ